MKPLVALTQEEWDYLLDSIEQKAEDIDDSELSNIAYKIRFELGQPKGA